MIAFYKIKCDHICSIPNKKLTKKKANIKVILYVQQVLL